MRRCTCSTSDGRRCWLLPGHDGKHLVLPKASAANPASIKRIFQARPDMTARELGPLLLNEALQLRGGSTGSRT